MNIGFGFCVFNSIWEHRLKIFFDPPNRRNRPPKIEHFSEVWTIFVRNMWGDILGIFGPLTSLSSTLECTRQLFKLETKEMRPYTKKTKILSKYWKSKSTVYPPKQTRTDVSGHRSGAEFWCASFRTNLFVCLIFY